MFVSFFIALQFLTLAPPLVNRVFTPAELGKAPGYFPLVGMILGGVLLVVNRLLSLYFPPGVQTAGVLAAWIVLTGALHLDGFLDTCDSLGGYTPERRLEIMRDHQIGAYALAGGVLLLLLKYQALVSILGNGGVQVLITAPVLARWGIVLAVKGFPYARPQGMGRQMKDEMGWFEVFLATAVTLLAGWWLLAWWGLVLAAVVFVFVLVMGWVVMRLVPGLTGDVYGALCELSELLVLLVFAARLVPF